jgi:hypothetical protein
VGKGTGKLVAKALDRVQARYQVTRPGVGMPFEEQIREAAAEACVMLGRRVEKKRRKIREAAAGLCADEAMRAAMGQLAVSGAGCRSADAVPAWFSAFADGISLLPEWNGVPGLPRWHPEHPVNLGTDF